MGIDLGLGNVISSGIGALAGAWQMKQNQKMMQQQMDYNTKEREASQAFTDQQRIASQDYQTSEREAQNAYQEAIYNKYQSPEAMVQQYQNSGLNGKLAVEGAGSLGSMSASSGSNGGAPSGASSPTMGVSMPYGSLSDATAGFTNVANALKSLAEAKKSDVDTKTAEGLYDSIIKKANAEASIAELGITSANIKNEEAAMALQKLTVEVGKARWDTEVVKKQLDILEDQKAITHFQRETWFDEYYARQRESFAREDASRSQADLNRVQSVLVKLMHKTEQSKPALNRALEKHFDKLSQLDELRYEIESATKEEEKEALKYEYKERFGTAFREWKYLKNTINFDEDDYDTMEEWYEAARKLVDDFGGVHLSGSYNPSYNVNNSTHNHDHKHWHKR